MTCDCRGYRRAGLFWPTVLAAGICLVAAGCGWAPELRPGPLDPVPWLSSKPGSEVGSKAFKKKVEADSFPTAAQTGV